MSLLLAVSFLAVSFLSVSAQAQAPPPSSLRPPAITDSPSNRQDGGSVPIITDSKSGITLVHIWVNDKADATFVVNTATNVCLISDSLAKKLDLARAPAEAADGYPFILDSKRPDAVTLKTLRFGGETGLINVKPGEVPFLIVPDQRLLSSPNSLVDGMIGADVLSTFAIGFDFSRHVMTFCHPGKLTASEVNTLGYSVTPGYMMPLSATAANDYTVQVGLQNKGVSRQMNFGLGTAAQQTSLSRQDAQQLLLVPLRPSLQIALGSNLPVYESGLSLLALGSLRISDLTVSYGTNLNGVSCVGMDILSHCRILIDFPGRKVYFQPAPPMVAPAK